MKLTDMTMVLAVAIVLTAGVAQAQQIKKGELSGTLMSGHALVTANGQANVLQTSSKGQFIMTQFCKEDGDTELQGSSLGVITTTNGCTEFSPGVPIPRDEVLFCRNDDNQSRSCSVMGVLSKK
jgi:hypothetical protein